MPKNAPALAHRLRSLLLVLGAFAPCVHATQDPPSVPADLLEVPRVGVVFKGGAAASKSRDSWRAEVAAHASEPEVLVLDALPASAAKAATPPPRWLVVFEEANSETLAARTVEYEYDLGHSARIRYRGARSSGRARIYEMGEKPVEIAVLGDQIDESYPAKEARFDPGESKKEIAIDAGAQLDRLLVRMIDRALALASAIDLWRARARLVELSAHLDPEPAARFWRRASAVTLDPWYGTTPVPWYSLETSALALWKRAPAAAARFPRPSTSCAWCDKPAPEAESACACPDSRALAGAKLVLAHSFGRKDSDGTRKAALAVEVPFTDLDPSRATKWKAAVPKLEARLKAEHAADRARLVARLGLRAERVQGKQTYAILVLREASGWIPADPDLERHASELIQAFPMGSADARSFYGADAARPGLALTRWDTKTNWYAPVGRREFKGAPEEIEAILVRALWDNSRGVETEPAARGGSAR